MRLYVGPMDTVLVECDQVGLVRFDGEDWSEPSLQERRAILYAAQKELVDLQELIEALETPVKPGLHR